MDPLDRFTSEAEWVAECQRVVRMCGDLLTIGSDPVGIPRQDLETLMLLIAGLIGALES